MNNKDYSLELVKQDRIRKPKAIAVRDKIQEVYPYRKGDRVKLNEHDGFGIVYKEMDDMNNLLVFYKEEFIEVNVKRLTLDIAASELYPKDYDFDTLFIDYNTRKMEHDIERGSKKALRKIQKEIKR